MNIGPHRTPSRNVTPVSVTQPVASNAAATTTAAAPTDAAAPAASVATTPGLYAMPITASVSGTAPALSKFLDQLQAVQPRAVLISSIGMAAGSTGQNQPANSYTLQLTMQAFVAPSSPAEGAALSSSAAH